MTDLPVWRRRAYLRNCRILALVSATAAIFYLKWLLFDVRPENHTLYWLLVAAELFSVVQSAGFWITISKQRWPKASPAGADMPAERVDIFITVCGEPASIVEKTVVGALKVRHPSAFVWILDDGGSPEIRALWWRYPVGYIHRKSRRGAKAGNINHALAKTNAKLFAVFDADQIPRAEFLEATLGVFSDEKVAFVQTPQVYRDRWINRVSGGANDQQGLFYGPILRGKNGFGAVFSCGTNVVYRRSAVDAVGGFPEDSITEDLRLSLLLLSQGYTSEYVPTVLAEGLGPMEVSAYFNQQLRWARGGLEILLKRRPYSAGMTPGQALQYSLGFLYWFTGWSYLIYLALPVLFLLGGFQPITTPNQYPGHFLPYVAASLFTIVYASNFQVTFDALWFTLASFPVMVKALVVTVFGGTATFVVTPKEGGAVSFKAVRWHLVTCAVLLVSAVVGIARYGLTPSVFNNVAWVIAHMVILLGFVGLTLNPVRTPAVAARLAEEHAEEAERARNQPLTFPTAAARSASSADSVVVAESRAT